MSGVERVRRSHEEVEFVKVDVDSSPGLALALGIMSIPTVVHFSEEGRREVARSVGVLRARDLVARLALDGG